MSIRAKVTDAGEFLALIPALLGYQPVESVVVVVFDGTLSRGAMRFDMPADRATAAQLGLVATGLACRVPDVSRLALVVYGAPELATSVYESFSASTEAAGLGIVEALVVAEGAWSRIGSEDAPVPVAPLPEQFTEMVAAGDQSTGAVLPDVDPELRAAVADHLAAGTENFLPSEMIRLFERAVDATADALSPADLATLVFCLARPALRDVAIVQWTQGPETGMRALEAQAAWETGTAYPSDLASVMWGEGARPDPRILERALTVCAQAAAVAPVDEQPGALATVAWLSWSLGRSTHADAYASQALRINPEHGLAEIVQSFVNAGHLPAWAFDYFTFESREAANRQVEQR